MIFLLIVAGTLICLFLLMTGILAAVMLTQLHRNAAPAEPACCPMFYGEEGAWEECA